MKRIIIILLTAFLFSSCGGKSVSGKKLGEEVCDCSDKANAMDAKDPNRLAAQADCSKKQVESWNKVKDNRKESDEFNKVLKEHLDLLIKKQTEK
jgi:hypothetical protein